MVLSLVRPELSTEPTFAQFWQIYPRHRAKKDAEKAWARMQPQDQQDAIVALPQHVRHWNGKEIDFLPYPATWLLGRRWEDELPKYGATVQLEAKCSCGRSLAEGWTQGRSGRICNPCFAEGKR